MQIFSYPNWGPGSLEKIEIEAPPRGTKWAGVAIGPNSEESLVELNGGILQSGRIYPLELVRGQIKRVRPNDANLGINTLELALFESPDELAISGCVARATATYGGQRALNPGLLAHFTAPFAGRRQAEIVIASLSGSPAYDYTIFGIKWHYGAQVAVAYPLHSASNEWTQQGVGTTPDIAVNNTYGVNTFYIGGTNESENWEALHVRIKNNAVGAATFAVDINVMGDSGIG